MKNLNEKVIYSLFILVLIVSVIGFVDGRIQRGRALDEARAERDGYNELHNELMGELSDAGRKLDEATELLTRVGDEVGKLEREHIESGDDIVGIGIKSDENLRIIRELRRRKQELEEETNK